MYPPQYHSLLAALDREPPAVQIATTFVMAILKDISQRHPNNDDELGIRLASTLNGMTIIFAMLEQQPDLKPEHIKKAISIISDLLGAKSELQFISPVKLMTRLKEN